VEYQRLEIPPVRFTVTHGFFAFQMLATASSAQLGGRDIDHILADYFAEDFKNRYKVDAKSNQRAYLRLLSEVEKLKKQMSANSTKLPINIECFMDDKDVHGDMNRAQMEELCSKLFDGVHDVMQQCLKDSSKYCDLSSTSHFVKGVISKFFHDFGESRDLCRYLCKVRAATTRGKTQLKVSQFSILVCPPLTFNPFPCRVHLVHRSLICGLFLSPKYMLVIYFSFCDLGFSSVRVVDSLRKVVRRFTKSLFLCY